MLAVSRAFIAEAGAAFEPELALLEVPPTAPCHPWAVSLAQCAWGCTGGVCPRASRKFRAQENMYLRGHVETRGNPSHAVGRILHECRAKPLTLPRQVVAHTHWLPRHWRGRAHTREVQGQFQQLFQFKASMPACADAPVCTPRWSSPRPPSHACPPSRKAHTAARHWPGAAACMHA